MVETRSKQEQDLIAWASTLTKKDVDALTAFMEQFLVTTPAETLQLPKFSGLDHEDPQNFLELCEKGLATTNPALWRDKIATRLRGSAAEWWSHNTPFTPTYEDLKRAVVNKYGGPEIVIELHAQYYGTRQAVDESTDSFLSRKRRIAKRIFPNITEEKFIATCRFLVIDPSRLQEPPQPRHPADVVPHVPFAGGPNQGHHQRPQHPPDPVPERAQGPADRQAPGGAYLDEKDAASEMTADDAAEEFPPQKTGYLYHSQEPIEDREPDLHTVRDDKQAGQVDIEPIGDRESYQRAQPPLEREHGEMTTAAPPPEDAPAVSAERTGKKLNDDLQLPAAETTAEKHPPQQGKLALSAALPSEPGPVPAQLSKVVAVILTRPHRSDRQQQLRPPQPQHDPTPRLSTTLGAKHTQEKPPREQPPDAERPHQRRLPLPHQDSALQ
jgi:hypothetical protein